MSLQSVPVDSLSEAHRNALQIISACPYLPTRAEYISHLKSSGFVSISFDDVTLSFRNFCLSRYRTFTDLYDSGVGVKKYGSTLYLALRLFYSTVGKLFEDKIIGGCKIIAHR